MGDKEMTSFRKHAWPARVRLPWASWPDVTVFGPPYAPAPGEASGAVYTCRACGVTWRGGGACWARVNCRPPDHH